MYSLGLQSGSSSDTPPSLHDLLASALVARSEWDRLPLALRRDLQEKTSSTELLPALVQHRLLTNYQARRLATGQRFGLVLGDYRVLDRIGSGTRALVFRAEHRHSRRHVALKVLPVLHGQDKRITQRFMQEVRITTRLRHPHIVHTMGAGATRRPDASGPTLLYFVMEYVPGQDLEDYVRQYGPLRLDRVVGIAREVAGALAEAHNRGMVHRDVKPRNIRLTPEDRAVLLDFGLARWGYVFDEPGEPLGSVAYMAPEQVHYAERVDIRADLYGLGGTLYWCLTGHPPFPVQGSAGTQLAARLRLPPPSVRDQRPEVPPAFDEILQKLLALYPADRFVSPGELLAALALTD